MFSRDSERQRLATVQTRKPSAASDSAATMAALWTYSRGAASWERDRL